VITPVKIGRAFLSAHPPLFRPFFHYTSARPRLFRKSSRLPPRGPSLTPLTMILTILLVASSAERTPQVFYDEFLGKSSLEARSSFFFAFYPLPSRRGPQGPFFVRLGWPRAAPGTVLLSAVNYSARFFPSQI